MRANVLHETLSIQKDASLEFIDFLLHNGLELRINDRNYNNQTAIAIAVERKRWDIVALLIKHGADINMFGPKKDGSDWLEDDDDDDRDWASPLIWELEGNCGLETYEKLVEFGADLTAVSETNMITVLHAVCTRTRCQQKQSGPGDARVLILRELLATEAKQFINSDTVDRKTPLTEAVAWIIGPVARHTSGAAMVDLLLDNGADLLAGVEQGFASPLQCAIDRDISLLGDFSGCEQIFGMLKKASFLVDHPQRTFLDKLLRRLLRSKGTCSRFWFGHVLALMAAGAQPDNQDEEGNAALSTVFQALLCMPPWLIQDMYRDMYRHRLENPGHLTSLVAAILQQSGASLHVKNHKHLTPLDYLRQIQHYDGEDKVRERLAKVAGRAIRVHPTSQILIFHPEQRECGDLKGENTSAKLYSDKSRWLFCQRTHHRLSGYPSECERTSEPGQLLCTEARCSTQLT